MAQIPEWALEKIRKAKEWRLTAHDLKYPGHGQPLAQIPDEVFDLEHLEDVLAE